MKLEKELLEAAATSDDGAGTRAARAVTVRMFCKALREANHLPVSIDQVRTGAVLKFVAAMRARGLSVRTMHNRMAHLRTLLPEALKGWTNKRLELGTSCRDGTKRAIQDHEYAERLARIRDPGCRAAIELQRALGLRAQESVRSAQTLRKWAVQLRAGAPLRLVYGAKGGRKRDIWPIDRDRALRAVETAVAVAKANGGYLVVGAQRVNKRTGRQTPALRSALKKLESATRRAGFIGEITQHSNRYSFTQDQLRAYGSQGYDPAEARAQTSQDLGHGDGRGTWVAQVYSRR